MTPTVRTADLGFRYPGSTTPVFEHIEMEVHPGEMVALVGRSGEGKSTLLYLIGLFLHATVGELFILGQPASEMNDGVRSRVRARRVGFIFQDALLHRHLTMRENVAEGAVYAGVEAPDALLRADALLEQHGIGHVAGHRPPQVSGGQGQRAALCRALIRSPALLLADEPTGSIDSENADLVVTSLRSAAVSGTAVIVATHSAEVAGRCDRILRIHGLGLSGE